MHNLEQDYLENIRRLEQSIIETIQPLRRLRLTIMTLTVFLVVALLGCHLLELNQNIKVTMFLVFVVILYVLLAQLLLISSKNNTFPSYFNYIDLFALLASKTTNQRLKNKLLAASLKNKYLSLNEIHDWLVLSGNKLTYKELTQLLAICRSTT